MEGPAFSTRAESHMYRSWGADIINMSALPEAKLAREAEIVYQMVFSSILKSKRFAWLQTMIAGKKVKRLYQFKQ